MAIIGFSAIAYLCPAAFVIEIGVMRCQLAQAAIMENIPYSAQARAAMYTSQMVRNSTPAFSGHPTRRKRLFIIG